MVRSIGRAALGYRSEIRWFPVLLGLSGWTCWFGMLIWSVLTFVSFSLSWLPSSFLAFFLAGPWAICGSNSWMVIRLRSKASLLFSTRCPGFFFQFFILSPLFPPSADLLRTRPLFAFRCLCVLTIGCMDICECVKVRLCRSECGHRFLETHHCSHPHSQNELNPFPSTPSLSLARLSPTRRLRWIGWHTGQPSIYSWCHLCTSSRVKIGSKCWQVSRKPFGPRRSIGVCVGKWAGAVTKLIELYICTHKHFFPHFQFQTLWKGWFAR